MLANVNRASEDAIDSHPPNYRCFDVKRYQHLQYFNSVSSCLACRLHVLVQPAVTDEAAVDSAATAAITVYVEKLQPDDLVPSPIKTHHQDWKGCMVQKKALKLTNQPLEKEFFECPSPC